MSELRQLHEFHKWAYYDFVLEVIARDTECSECHRKIKKGEKGYVSRRNARGRFNPKGAVAKRVCSEDCGEAFDFREMEAAAGDREDEND